MVSSSPSGAYLSPEPGGRAMPAGIRTGARERMKAIVFHEHGGPEVLRYEEFPDPVCGPRDVIVRAGAAALNGFEPMILAKTTALRTPLPMIPCGDAAGEVVAVGPEGEGWRGGGRGGATGSASTRWCRARA